MGCLSTDAALLTVSVSPCSVCFYFWNTQISDILHRTSPKILYSTPLLLTSMTSPQNDTFSPYGHLTYRNPSGSLQSTLLLKSATMLNSVISDDVPTGFLPFPANV